MDTAYDLSGLRIPLDLPIYVVQLFRILEYHCFFQQMLDRTCNNHYRLYRMTGIACRDLGCDVMRDILTLTNLLHHYMATENLCHLFYDHDLHHDHDHLHLCYQTLMTILILLYLQFLTGRILLLLIHQNYIFYYNLLYFPLSLLLLFHESLCSHPLLLMTKLTLIILTFSLTEFYSFNLSLITYSFITFYFNFFFIILLFYNTTFLFMGNLGSPMTPPLIFFLKNFKKKLNFNLNVTRFQTNANYKNENTKNE